MNVVDDYSNLLTYSLLLIVPLIQNPNSDRGFNFFYVFPVVPHCFLCCHSPRCCSPGSPCCSSPHCSFPFYFIMAKSKAKKSPKKSAPTEPLCTLGQKIGCGHRKNEVWQPEPSDDNDLDETATDTLTLKIPACVV